MRFSRKLLAYRSLCFFVFLLPFYRPSKSPFPHANHNFVYLYLFVLFVETEKTLTTISYTDNCERFFSPKKGFSCI
jgi:hypothetical protein